MKILNTFLLSIQTLAILSVWQSTFEIVECRDAFKRITRIFPPQQKQQIPLQKSQQQNEQENPIEKTENKGSKQDETKQETKNNVISSQSDSDLVKRLNSIEKELHDLTEQIGQLAEGVNEKNSDIGKLIEVQKTDNKNADIKLNNNNNDKKGDTNPIRYPFFPFPGINPVIVHPQQLLSRGLQIGPVLKEPLLHPQLLLSRGLQIGPVLKEPLRKIIEQIGLNDQKKLKLTEEQNGYTKPDENHENDQNQTNNYEAENHVDEKDKKDDDINDHEKIFENDHEKEIASPLSISTAKWMSFDSADDDDDDYFNDSDSGDDYYYDDE